MERHKATITSKGQVTIPVRVREYLEIDPGDEIEMEITDDGIVVLKKERRKGDIAQMIDPQELLNDVNRILDKLRVRGQSNVLTVDVIRAHQGNYFNARTSPKKSWNARFGKFLKDNQERLRIKEVRKDVSTYDDNGNHTSCSEWEVM